MEGTLKNTVGTPRANHVVYIIPADIPFTDHQAVEAELSKAVLMKHATCHGGGRGAQKCWTDSQGQFVSQLLRAGTYTLVFGDDFDRDVKTVQVPYGETIRVELVPQ